MKVVLFCGGMGLRLREYSENVPKPMVPIGYRPIVWHLMKYYAHYGHRDFVLCLGYRADVIKQYFLDYNECLSNDFVLSRGGKDLKLLGSDITSWRITFVDTGLEANVGQRLLAVKDHLKGEETFLANYSDNLTDVPLPAMIDQHHSTDSIASFLSVVPAQSFHLVRRGEGSLVREILPVQRAGMRINGGFFTLNKQIFDYIHHGEDLVLEPFQRLIQVERLSCYEHDGFWACMDTFKERQTLEDLSARGNPPWQVWRGSSNGRKDGQSQRRDGAAWPAASRSTTRPARNHGRVHR